MARRYVLAMSRAWGRPAGVIVIALALLVAVVGIAPAATPPSAPRNLAAQVDAATSAVTLTWDAPTTGPVTDYYVYVWYGNEPTRFGAGSTSGTPTIDVTCNLAEGCTYAVTAVNTAGESSESLRVSVGGEVPSAPTGLTATVISPLEQTVRLTWSEPSVGPVTDYYAYVWYGDFPTRFGAGSSSGSRSLDVTCNLEQGCTYAVTAVNAAGESEQSNLATAGPNQSPPAPSVAGASVGTAGESSIVLTPAAATGQQWQRKVGSHPWGVVGDAPTCPSFAAGCQFRLVGLSGAGTVSGAALPLLVTGPTAVRTPTWHRLGAARQLLRWKAPSNDGGFAVHSYTIERRQRSDAAPGSGSGRWTPAGSVPASETEHRLPCPGQVVGRTCDFRVIAQTIVRPAPPATAACTNATVGGLRPQCARPFQLDNGAWGAHATDNRTIRWLRADAVTLLDQLSHRGSSEAPMLLLDGCAGDSAVEAAHVWKRCWPAPEQNDTLWYPQGVATNHDTAGWRPGRDMVLVSWYKRTTSSDSTATNSRISVIDSLSGRYVHLQLRAGCGSGCVPTAVRTHAGGVAVVGPYVYVADTKNGLQVYDLRRLARVNGSLSMIRVAWYRPVTTALAFSSVSSDGTTTFGGTASLVVAEYKDGTKTDVPGRVVTYPVRENGRISDPAYPSGAPPKRVGRLDPDIMNIQGAEFCQGRLLLSRSRGKSTPGTLYVGAEAGEAYPTAWPIGPEDMACTATGRVLTVGEHPGKRMIVSYAGSDLAAAALPG